MKGLVRYQTIWGICYILSGIAFAIVFILGGYILADPSIYLNLIAAVIIIYIGNNIRTKPYIRYDQNEILVYNLFGSIRKRYKIENESTLTITNKKFYIAGKKLRLNHWFMDKQDWHRFESFYNREPLLDELKT
ncbi:hypothetical protein [Crocinitomix catalasitica]|uniref:hypothetical protein n=1 Tax=Crocinitomix catalasitica TaxID=184607 RepID=UPI000489BDB4|nr:hypothetical protein [Crocinitomix catalasitica]